MGTEKDETKVEDSVDEMAPFDEEDCRLAGIDFVPQDDRQREAQLRRVRAIMNGEQSRVTFIRQSAIAYASSLEQIDGDLSEPEVLALIWSDARALWNAKPEDC